MILLTALILLIPYSTGKPTSSCNMEKVRPRISLCISNLLILMEPWKNRLNLNDEQKKMYLKDCEFFNSCKPYFECAEGLNDRLKLAVKTIGAQCKTFKFLFLEFVECDKKIEILNSTCHGNYDSFPNTENGTNEKCENLMGENDCMRADILKVCGKKHWKGYREIHIKMAQTMRLCQL